MEEEIGNKVRKPLQDDEDDTSDVVKGALPLSVTRSASTPVISLPKT